MFSRQQLQALAAVAALALAGLTAACGNSSSAQSNRQGAEPAAAAESVEVSTAPAVGRSLPRYIEATGSLAADVSTDVAPTVGGKVVGVGFDLGSFVRQGQALVRLDAGDAQLRVEQAQAALQQALSTVRQAEARINLRPDQPFDPTGVAEVQASKAALDLAERQLARFERLLESGDVSRASYDQQRAQRDQLREQYNSALAQARQSYAAVQTARAAVNAARVQVEQARKGVRDVVVYAPISGFVAEKNADLGEYVSTASKVATIVRTDPMRVRIDIPEQDIGRVGVGQGVSVGVSAYPDRNFAGRVARVSPNVSAASRTLTVEAEVSNPDGLLKPGQFATVRVQLPTSDPAVLVPTRAVRTEGTTSRVFVVRDGVVEERLVALGRREGDLVEVRGNVVADEPVATSNLEQLSDGTPVRQ
ncbi:MAG TPA: efflux RND transporter periplasmic adaptor subunit [Pyrinomonadaceae bacterium]|nr:efflux RND transporter periplasmic adaptor subunit [Pyrinomonadaceae bacterium]